MKKYFLNLLLAFLFVGCALNTDSVKIADNFDKFEIFDTETKQIISYNSFIQKLLTNDIVLLGEIHNTSKHHFLEKKIILDLVRHKDTDVVFEMGSADLQDAWDTAKNKKYEIKPNRLKSALNWDEKWNYKYYKDLVESVFYSNANLVAGNLSKEEIKTIYLGAMPLNGIKSTKTIVKSKIKNYITSSHNIEDDKLLDKMVQIQQYKDRRMADKLVNSKNFSVLVAGRLHTDKDMGVPLHIDDFNKNKKYISVALGIKDEKPCDSIKRSADYLILFTKGEK